MKWTLLGLLILVLAYAPGILAAAVTLAATIATQPLALAFVLGWVLRPALRRSRPRRVAT